MERAQPRQPLSPDDAAHRGDLRIAEGEPDHADPILIAAFDAAMQVDAVPFAAMILAERCVIAMERSDWKAAAQLSDQARAIVEGAALDDYWTSALVYAVAARVEVHRGNTTRAREDAAAHGPAPAAAHVRAARHVGPGADRARTRVRRVG